MFGSHLSVAGGLDKALTEASRLGMDTVQVFTASPRNPWGKRPVKKDDVDAPKQASDERTIPALPDDVIDGWKRELKRVGFRNVVSHDSYLINLASPDAKLRANSIALFDQEIRRCDQLGIKYLVTHPGAHMGERDDATSESAGLDRVADAINGIFASQPKSKAIVCLEITAGQGTGLGHKLEQLATIIQQVKKASRIGVCLDTAHLFAGGYDFRGKKYTSLLKQIDATVGLDRILVWHLNDSKKALGSRVDRHDHIGLGTIGIEGFRPIVRDKRWRDTPKILETPKLAHSDGLDWDTVNLELLKSIM